MKEKLKFPGVNACLREGCGFFFMGEEGWLEESDDEGEEEFILYIKYK